MNFLPKELENIIVDYKCQLEHKQKFNSSLNKIKQITYKIDQEENTSERIINIHVVRMHNNDDKNGNQLWFIIYDKNYGEIMIHNKINKTLIDSDFF